MSFRPSPCRSRWEALLVISWILIADLSLLIWITRRPVDGISFLMLMGVLVSLPVLLWLGFRTWGAFNLAYSLDRNALRIRWAGTEQVIPMSEVQQVITGGQELGGRSLIHWPAPFVRSGTGLGILYLHRFATRPLPDCVLIQTPSATFALSPLNQEQFLESLERYHSLGPLRPVSLARRGLRFCPANPLADPAGRWLLGLGMAGALLLFGLLMIQYPSLPEMLVFNYNSLGQPESVRPRQALFLLPIIGLAAFFVNGVGGVLMGCQRQRVGAYLLWGSTLLVQTLVFLAMNNLI